MRTFWYKKTLKNDLFYIEKITLQNDVNFPRIPEIYGERGWNFKIFRKNRNIDLECSSLFHCKANMLYFMCLERFYLELISSTFTFKLNLSAKSNFLTSLDISITTVTLTKAIDFIYFFFKSTQVYNHFDI